MAIRTWSGGGAGNPNNWANVNNWDEGAVPTAVDDVVINPASLQYCTTNTGGAATCKSIDFRGIADMQFSINVTINQTTNTAFALRGGSMLFNFGLTHPTITGTYTFNSASATGIRIEDLNLNNAVTPAASFAGLNVLFNSSAGTATWALANSDCQFNNVTLQSGQFSLGGHNLQCAKLVDTSTGTRSAIINGTLTLTGTGTVFSLFTGGTTFTVTGAPDIIITDTSASTKSFFGSAKVYGNLILSRGGSGIFAISGINTWSSILGSGTGALNVTFVASQTTTIGSGGGWFPSVGMDPNNWANISSATPGTPFTVSCVTQLETNYLTLTDCTAAGTASARGFDAGYGNNGGGNTKWMFHMPQTQVPTWNTRAIGAMQRAGNY